MRVVGRLGGKYAGVFAFILSQSLYATITIVTVTSTVTLSKYAFYENTCLSSIDIRSEREKTQNYSLAR
jgi:hypothetical protein